MRSWLVALMTLRLVAGSAEVLEAQDAPVGDARGDAGDSGGVAADDEPRESDSPGDARDADDSPEDAVPDREVAAHDVEPERDSQHAPGDASNVGARDDRAPDDERDERAEVYGAAAEVQTSPLDDDRETRTLSGSSVSRAQMDERQPRSTPDALRYEPGVAIQQTAHAQASSYVRGMTGQQVVHLFDGVRMNNGIYRQGPNQYFFTVDQRSVARLDVLRGSASVRYGSDGLGGAILAVPVRPLLDPDLRGVRARPRVSFRYGSADREVGGRGQLELRLGSRTAVLLGGGYRDVDLLRSGGVVRHPDGTGGTTRGEVAPWAPRFDEERAHPTEPDRWRTQLGTGFREATYDARVEHRLPGRYRNLRVVAATYGYRQMDAPRTDQCPPREAPIEECLRIDRQFRTLSYVGLRGDAGPVRDLELLLSHQRHVERRVRDRPRSFQRFQWDDVVDTIGLTLRGSTPVGRIGERTSWRVRWGGEAYRDGVQSKAFGEFTDIEVEFDLSRGQYLEGSAYHNLGAWAELEVAPREWLVLRSGGRVAVVNARAPPDPESGTRPVDRTWSALVGRAGVEVRPANGWRILANFDQGFRAPNLDDLTSRQQTGPGFQFENPDLEPERTNTAELGVSADLGWLRLDAWVYATLLDRGIQRIVREAEDCPPNTAECNASRDQFQLVNAEEQARIFGAEGGATVYLPERVTLRGTVTYAWGDGPSLGDRGATPPGTRVALSRIPPLQGTFEARWRHRPTGLWLAGALRWARIQDRLAISDQSDARIPDGGTPGYAVVDLRAGWRFREWLLLSVVFENVADAAYRVHGSSINGPGRGVLAHLRVGY